MATARLQKEEISRRGEALYHARIREQLDLEADQGKFLVVDVGTGDYEVDRSDVAALHRLRARQPEAVVYILRIGRAAAYHLGRNLRMAPA